MNLENLTEEDLKSLEDKIKSERHRRKPKKIKIYLHRDKESNFDVGDTLGLTDEQMENFMYTGFDIPVDIEVDSDGYAWATHFAGVELPNKVQI